MTTPKPRRLKRHRDAITGRIVSASEATARPNETVTETGGPRITAADRHKIAREFCQDVSKEIKRISSGGDVDVNIYECAIREVIWRWWRDAGEPNHE